MGIRQGVVLLEDAELPVAAFELLPGGGRAAVENLELARQLLQLLGLGAVLLGERGGLGVEPADALLAVGGRRAGRGLVAARPARGAMGMLRERQPGHALQRDQAPGRAAVEGLFLVARDRDDRQ